MPLIFVPTDFMLSEAVNAYVEVPKTTALRTLAGIMLILWIAEWVLKGGLTRRYTLARYSTRLRDWLVEQPTRWVVVAAVAYVVVAIITTFLSQNFYISVWGEVSGQFGYSAYTTVSYFIVFAVIATHVKTRDQLWRLLGVIVLTGAVMVAYGVLQRFDADPLDLGETGASRITVTMANPVFTGATFVVTSLLTLGIGLTMLEQRGWSPLRIVLWLALISAQLIAVFWTGSRGSWLIGMPPGLLAFVALPVLAEVISSVVRDRSVPSDLLGLLGLLVLLGFFILAAQLSLLDLWDLPGLPDWHILLGFVGLLGWLSTLILLFQSRFTSGVQIFAKTFPVVASGLLITILVVMLTPTPLNNIELGLRELGGLPNLWTLVGPLGGLALLSILVLSLPPRMVVSVIRSFTKAFLVVVSGLFIALFALGLTFPTPGGPSDGGETAAVTTQVEGEAPDDASEIPEQIPEVESAATQRGLSFRTDIWSASWGLIINRPWFEYESLRISYLRPLVGYGPEMFKYTFPLESPLGGLLSHAHNFFMHHLVEQGILGFLTSVSLFLSFFVVGAVQLWGKWRTYSTTHKWLLIALLATMVGKIGELLVGVARESDLILVWILLAAFVVLPSVMAPAPQAEAASAGAQEPERPPQPRGTRGERRRGGSSRQRDRRARQSGGSPGPQIIPLGVRGGLLLSVVVLLIGWLGWLTWDKNVDYAWAAVLGASARDKFDERTLVSLQEGYDRMAQANDKAPDVPIYYNNLGALFDAYKDFAINNPEANPVPCEEFFSLGPSTNPTGSTQPFARCAEEAYLINLRAFEKNKTAPQAKLTLANSTLRLALLGYSRERGEDISDEAIRYYDELAQMLPLQPNMLANLGEVLLRLDRPGQAVEVYERVQAEHANRLDTEAIRRQLVTSYQAFALSQLKQGQSQEAQETLDETLDKYLAITQGSTDAGTALYLQGVAYRQQGELQQAVNAFEQSLAVDPKAPNSVESRLIKPQEALESLEEFLASGPNPAQSAVVLYLQGLAYQQQNELAKAIEAFEQSLALAGEVSYTSETRRHLVDAYNAESVSQLQSGQAQAAIETLEKYVAITQGSTDAGTALYLQGVAYRQLEELDKSADSLEQSLEVDASGPNAANVHRALGEVYILLRRPQEAVDILEEAIATFGDQINAEQFQQSLVSAYHSLTLSQVQQNQTQEALETLDRYLAVTEGTTDAGTAFYLQGVVYQRLEELEKSLDSLMQSLEVDADGPNVADVHQLLAAVYTALGNQEQADEHARLSEELSESSP